MNVLSKENSINDDLSDFALWFSFITSTKWHVVLNDGLIRFGQNEIYTRKGLGLKIFKEMKNCSFKVHSMVYNISVCKVKEHTNLTTIIYGKWSLSAENEVPNTIQSILEKERRRTILPPSYVISKWTTFCTGNLTERTFDMIACTNRMGARLNSNFKLFARN